MKRGKFILTGLSILPMSIFANLKFNLSDKLNKGFKICEGEGRYESLKYPSMKNIYLIGFKMPKASHVCK